MLHATAWILGDKGIEVHDPLPEPCPEPTKIFAANGVGDDGF
jgi:hypothetical protein